MNFKILTLLLLVGLFHRISGRVESKPCCRGDNIIFDGKCLINVPGKSPIKEHTMLKCSEGMFIIDPSEDESDAFTVNDVGTLIVGNGSIRVGADSYCLTKKSTVTSLDESITLAKGTQLVEIAIVCFYSENDQNLPFALTGALILTSVGFLLITLIVYIIVSELRDLQGKCIICTSFSLCLGFLFLGYAQLFEVRSACLFISFSTYFWMIATFFWMNVVSINQMKSIVFRNTKISDGRMFQIYSAYGWGMSLIFLLSAYIAHRADGDHIKPGFGEHSCWFSSEIPTWTYFYGPILVLILCNIVLFVITSIKLWSSTNYDNVTVLRSLKFKFMLSLKLFLVMGISWLFEIISFWHNTQHVVWLISDCFNCLQGVVFFLVLVVFRKRARRGLAERGILHRSCMPSGPRSADEECEEMVEEEERPSIMHT